MALYTVEIKDLVKNDFKIFDFPYDFYDPTKKADFEQKFINHFYFREIGVETPQRFRHYLMCKCHEVLPLYNEMLKVAQMEYDLINNYQLTEIFSKTNTATKNSNATTNNTLDRTSEVLNTGEKTNTLDSDTSHMEDTAITRNETQTDTATTTADNKNVESVTPASLLSMTDIKNNVYASKADIEDNTTQSTANKSNTTSETTSHSVSDKVDATSHDSTTDTHDETTTETNEGTISQNENAGGTENYTLTREGNIGVDTQSDMLRKHIEFQKTIRTAYAQFFDQCEDLFIQLYN